MLLGEHQQQVAGLLGDPSFCSTATPIACQNTASAMIRVPYSRALRAFADDHGVL